MFDLENPNRGVSEEGLERVLGEAAVFEVSTLDHDLLLGQLDCEDALNKWVFHGIHRLLCNNLDRLHLYRPLDLGVRFGSRRSSLQLEILLSFFMKPLQILSDVNEIENVFESSPSVFVETHYPHVSP